MSEKHESVSNHPKASNSAIEAPLNLHTDQVRAEWIDYNGHMNLAYYVLAFDYATDAFLDYLGMHRAFRDETNSSTFSAEIHVTYVQEVHEGDPIRITTQLLDYDQKRLHYFHSMYHAQSGYLAATNELMSLYMDMDTRKVSGMPDRLLERVDQVMGAHAVLEMPAHASSRIGIPPDRSLARQRHLNAPIARTG